MVARLAKNLSGERWRAMPVASAEQQFKELNAAEARAVRIAPADASDSPHRRKSPKRLGNELDRLCAALEAVTLESHPRTARLLGSSTRKVAQKVIEEAGEVALAAVKHNGRNVVRESADLLYHLAVLWCRAGIGPQEIWTEMRRRADSLGIAEKLPKSSA